MSEIITPSQTVGPFFAYGLTPAAYGLRAIVSNDLAVEGMPGERIRIEGQVLDGDGQPVPDAMVEIWQADPAGRYTTERPSGAVAFTGFGRTECDGEGRYGFATVKPGSVAGPGGASQAPRMQAPHVNVSVFARGVLKRLFTRIYFSDEARNREDPILSFVPEERRSTLIAPVTDRGGVPVYIFDIHLQGERETVFFEG